MNRITSYNVCYTKLLRSLHEDWANLAAASHYFSYFFERGQGGMNIIDHSGRLQVNSLITRNEDQWVVNEVQEKVWLKLLSLEEFELSQEEASAGANGLSYSTTKVCGSGAAARRTCLKSSAYAVSYNFV